MQASLLYSVVPAIPSLIRRTGPSNGAAFPTEILQRLEDATREPLEALAWRLPLLDPTLSNDAYRQFLGRFFGYYAPLEVSLYGAPHWQEIGQVYCDRRKTPRLALDLIALGATPEALTRLPRCAELPDVASSPRLLGCLYVIECGTLGGQRIARHLHARLGLTPRHGAAFFSGYGRHTPSCWRAFGANLAAHSQRSHGDGDDEIVAAAQQTLATISGWLFPPQRALPTAA